MEGSRGKTPGPVESEAETLERREAGLAGAHRFADVWGRGVGGERVGCVETDEAGEGLGRALRCR